MGRHQEEQGCGTSNVCYNIGCVVVPRLGGKGRCTGRFTTSRKHWRYGTTGVCCSGWRSPLLTGGASLVRIFLPPRAMTRTFEKPCSRELRRTPQPVEKVVGGPVRGPRPKRA